MILNCNTKVSEIPDQGKRRHCFEVVCGKTSKPYEISADDEKSRHDWILAIKKVLTTTRSILLLSCNLPSYIACFSFMIIH